MKKILIADDNADIITLLYPHFVNAKYEVTTASNGIIALNTFNSNHFDVVLLDIMMPKLNGLEVCEKIRSKSEVPIVMITAKNTDEDVIEGLDIGADDYIVKPFSPRQVLAKVEAILRRLDIQVDEKIIKINGLYIDMNDFTVEINNQKVILTKKEAEILYLLAKNKNNIFSRAKLLDLLWGQDYFGDERTVDTHIKRLRNKTKQFTDLKFSVTTVWGVGYKFEEID